jgi:hypothetical protein
VALGVLVELRQRQGDYSGAVAFAEEAYNLVVDAYDPVHPEVQEAAGSLIECLIYKGDFFNAQRYAEQTYENLRDSKNGMNQEGEGVARGAHNLADVIFQNVNSADLIKAEGLAREALGIRDKFHCPYHFNVGRSCTLLAIILQRKMELGGNICIYVCLCIWTCNV